MTRSKLTLLCLGAAVLGILAFGTGAAQAEVGAKWLIEKPTGEVLDAANLSAALGAEMENNHFLILTAALGITFLCQKATLVGFFLEKEGSLTEGGKIRFSACTMLVKGELIACTVRSPGAPPGVAETSPLKGLIVLHQLLSGVKDKLIRIEPAKGVLFMNIECDEVVGLPITGKLFPQGLPRRTLDPQGRPLSGRRTVIDPGGWECPSCHRRQRQPFPHGGAHGSTVERGSGLRLC
jgi:hypothetical protein